MKATKYRDIVDRLDVDAVEEAIGFLPDESKDEEDIGQCPDWRGLHKNGDTTGKFAIHRIKKVFNCWVCGGGSLLSLAMEMHNLTEQEGIDWLAQFAGEHVDDDGFVDEIEQLLTRDERERNPILPWFNERVIEKWMGAKTNWFEERGITDTVVSEFKLGYSPDHTRKSSKGNYTGPAIIFPHYFSGRMVGWQERWLHDDRPKWIPKYTNTSAFPRQYTLYNYERCWGSPDPIIVVESVPTVLFLASLGYRAVATFGSNVTPEQMELMRRFQQGVILAPDNDKPGRKFAGALGGYLERFIDVKVAPPVLIEDEDDGADLGDLADDPYLVTLVLEAAEYL